MLHKRRDFIASFSEHLIFQEKFIFKRSLWVNNGEIMIKKTIRILYILKLEYNFAIYRVRLTFTS